MKYLAIDASNDYLAIVLSDGKTRREYFSPDGKTRHSVSLMPNVERLFSEAGVEPKDVDFFCAVTGPGSFTGVRIGVSTVKAFSYALKKKILGVTAFELCSYNDSAAKKACVVDAAHGNFYVCGYTGGEVTLSARFLNEEELRKVAEEYKLFSVYPLSGIPSERIDVVKGLAYAAEKHAGEALDDVNAVSPFYLRLSQAEEGRK